MNSLRIVVVSLVLMFAACGSSPPTRYFSLQPLDIDYRADPESAAVLYVGPLRLPEYLARTQIVTRGDQSEMNVDDYHRWAEPLNDAIPRVVAMNVDSLLDEVVVVAFAHGNSLEPDYRLQGNIVRFDCDSAGRAVLIAQWGIATPQGEFLVAPRRSRFEARAARADDSDAVAVALSDTLAQFSRAIAAQIEGLHN